jgi:hypothetical protein
VQRNNQDGSLALVSYQDHGTLPADAPRPSRTRTNPVSSTFSDGSVCDGTETTTPSGQYRSNCHFNASH